jgi:ankyrin repeat protein
MPNSLDLTKTCLTHLNTKEFESMQVGNVDERVSISRRKQGLPRVWIDLTYRGGNKIFSSDVLQEQLNMEKQDHGGWTPLMWAAWNGHEKVVEILL